MLTSRHTPAQLVAVQEFGAPTSSEIDFLNAAQVLQLFALVVDEGYTIERASAIALRYLQKDSAAVEGRKLGEFGNFEKPRPGKPGLLSLHSRSSQPQNFAITLSSLTSGHQGLVAFPIAENFSPAEEAPVSQKRALAEPQAGHSPAMQPDDFFHAILNALPGMVGYWDKDLVCRYANAQYLVWFGKTVEEMLGIRIQDLMGPELYAKNKPYIDGALAGQPQEFERLLIKADQSRGWTQARYIPDIRNGIVRGFFVLVTDISPQKAAEEDIRRLNGLLEEKYLDQSQRLIEADQSYQEIFSHAPVAIIVRDLQTGVLVDINRLASEITGYSRDELLTLSADAFDTGLPEYPISEIGRFMESAKSGIPQRFEWPIRSKSGNIRWLDVMTVKANIGGKPRLLSFYQQIDERRAYQVRLAELNAHLEDKVEERTRELKGAINELQAFTYTVSHDLRAPLRAVAGFSNIVKAELSSSMTPQAEHYLGLIEQNALRLGTLIDDLLAFSNLGQKTLRLGDVDLAELTEHAVAEINRLLPNKAQFSLQASGRVRADFALLTQVMLNLLSNAVKYSAKEPTPRIEVFTVREEGSFTCCIADNGVGFSMLYVDKLFGVFERLHTSSEFEGVGVGLAIVKRIVDRHGGKIWAESEEGKGARFYFRLAAANEQD